MKVVVTEMCWGEVRLNVECLFDRGQVSSLSLGKVERGSRYLGSGQCRTDVASLLSQDMAEEDTLTRGDGFLESEHRGVT